MVEYITPLFNNASGNLEYYRNSPQLQNAAGYYKNNCVNIPLLMIASSGIFTPFFCSVSLYIVIEFYWGESLDLIVLPDSI